MSYGVGGDIKAEKCTTNAQKRYIIIADLAVPYEHQIVGLAYVMSILKH